MAKKITKTKAEPAAGKAGNPGQTPPKFRIGAVYLKDVSFESPLAPAVFGQGLPAPKIRLEINVNVFRLEAAVFEVALKVEAEATLPDNKTLFMLELLQGGVFILSPDLAEDETKKTLAVDCATALFPFARQSVAELTRNGGFAPLMLDQIEFKL